MKDKEKTKEQLINDLIKLYQRINKLETQEFEYKKTETTLRKSEKKIKQFEEKYRSLFENMPGAYFQADTEGNILIINSPGAKLLGYNSPKEIIGKNLAKDLYYIPEDRKKFLEELKKRKGSVKDYEATLKKRDGTPVIVSTSSHYYYDEKGNIAGVEGIFVDITERKEAEMAIIYEQSLLHALMDNISDTVYFKDKEKRFIRVNKVKAEHSEVTPEEMIGKTDFDFFPPEIAKQSSADDDLVIKSAKPIIDKVEKIIYSDKTEHWVSTTKVPWYNSEGKIIGTIGITRDITERKEAEEMIVYEQSLLHALMDNIPDFINFKDEKNRFVRVNKASGEDRGIKPEDFIGETDFDIFTEEAAKKCFADDDRVMKTGKPLINRIEKITYLNGMERWFSATKVPRYDEKGKIIGTIGITRDITQRKKMEEDLQKLAHFDNLTGSCNRGYGIALLDQQLKLAHRKKQKISLAYFDIDGFKDINDTFGHEEGDRVLKEVAKLFKSTLRKVDIICRIGGDEFLLIFPDSSLNDVPLIIERLNKNLEKLNQTLNKPYKIGFSIGISYYDPDHPQSIDELISIADENMYKEKNKKSKQSEDSIKD